MRLKIRKRPLIIAALSVGLLALACVVVRPVYHLISVSSRDVRRRPETPPGFADDVSRLNRTKVAEVWRIPVDDDDPERQIAALLARARTEGKRVSIAGARHSMGGHTIYPDGIVIDMLDWNRMELDEFRDVLKVGAGALWKDIIPFLDRRGRSVAVMQSNNSFSVGGSISVNCHGWQYDRPPIASTVESFRIMKADGAIVRCSRAENPELFSLALGGYGLFGIILDVELRVAPNERYRLEQFLVASGDSLSTFDARIGSKPGIEMAFARMSIVPDRLFQEVVINGFFRDPSGNIPALGKPGVPELVRAVFRGSAESEYGKELRWNAETRLQPLLAGKVFSRNQLLNESVEFFQNNSPDSTDILHEYFVPRDRVEAFVAAMRAIVLRHRGNLLNVTVRSVNEDKDTFLRYADQPMLAFVMLFVQETNAGGEAKMQALTRELIDAAIEHEGRYYLPYRLHATHEQFARAYPQSGEFFDLKRTYDPEELFQNEFYVEYGALDAPTEGGDPNP